jgi:hypothetical protein
MSDCIWKAIEVWKRDHLHCASKLAFTFGKQLILHLPGKIGSEQWTNAQSETPWPGKENHKYS